MEPERFRSLLDAYGGDPERWPTSERLSMQEFLDLNPQAEAWRREAQALDLALADFPVAPADLVDRIMARIPPSRVERFLAWLLPTERHDWWRPAAAATLPLVLGVVIGMTEVTASGVGDLDWTAQEQALLLNDYESAWYE